MDEVKKVKQPKNLKKKLYPHQLSSIYMMEKFEIEKKIEKSYGFKHINIGVNADITGYGKTLSMIGLICRDRIEWDEYFPYTLEITNNSHSNLIKSTKIERYERINATLILVSPNIINQWEEELKFTNLKVLKINNIRLLKIKVFEYDVVLITHKLYNNLIEKYDKYAWKRFIFDEPNNLRVSNMKKIIAGFYWLISATPDSILYKYRNCRKKNFLKEIISGCNFDFQHHFSDIIIKNNEEFVRKSFNMPNINNYYYKCYQPIYNVIKDFTSPIVKNMIESGNISEAIKYLGGKKTDNIVNLIKNKYLEEIEICNSKINIYKLRHNINSVKKWSSKKSDINININNLDNKFNELLNQNCSICLSKITEPILEQNCHNIFCAKCIFTWLSKKNNCPLCRKDITIKELVYIDKRKNSNLVISKKDKCKTKSEMILEIIKSNKKGSFIIFSNFDESFSTIRKILVENNIIYSEIKGNDKNRDNIIKKFKQRKTQILFLNSNYNGSGINLQECTDIILYHKMNKNTKEQILGRANRIGRTKELNVHNLLINE